MRIRERTESQLNGVAVNLSSEPCRDDGVDFICYSSSLTF
jgi:hypothetical protein